MERGQHWLPGTVFGGRETLATSWLRAEPLHLLLLPGDGWWPLVAAAGTAGFFLLLTVAQTVLASLCGVLAVAGIVCWLWPSDQPPRSRTATVADGVALPVGASGAASRSWRAMVILLCVDASMLASLLFAHLHVSMAASVCPPPGAALPDVRWALVSAACLAAGSALVVGAGRRLGQRGGQARLCWLLALALLCLCGGIGLDLASQVNAGLNPKAEAWSASVAALLGWQGFHGVVLLLMAAYVLARAATGRLRADARATWDNTAVVWHYVTAQGCLSLLTVQSLPAWV